MGTDALAQRDSEQVIAAAARGELSEAQIEQLLEDDPRLAKLAFIAAVQAVTQLRDKSTAADHPDPATPSGQQPVYTKPNRAGRGKKRGAKVGHKGHRRPTPPQIDRHVEHAPLEQCPCCGEPVSPPRKHRTRIIIDLPEDLSTDTAEHRIPRQWCGGCKRYIEPTVLDAMPKSTLGHRTVATTAWLHYGLGVTIDQIVSILGHHLNTKLSAGGLVAMWHRLARDLTPWYEQIGEQAKTSAHLHADETGWRVDGATHWLWCFTNPRCCYYMIDPSRGSPALEKFFTDSFAGVLISDFWCAYASVLAGDRQYCLVHLLREIEQVSQHNDSADWRAFAKQLKRLVRDAVRLRRRCEQPAKQYPSRVRRIDQRLCALADARYVDADATRLAKRLSRHRDWLFTFLEYPHVPWENNFAERQIRPAVILRKNSQSNRSQKGAATQAVLMSVFRTLKLRDLSPTETLAHALRHLLQHGELPPLPEQAIADG
jgi:transposase